MQTQIHKDSWMISLGVAPAPDLLHLKKSTNNVTVKDDFEKERHSTKGISRLSVPLHEKKRMINEIMRMVKAGVDDRQHIYNQLIELDVLPKSGDKVMSPNSVWRYIQAARREVGHKPKTKIQQIIYMFDSGVSKKEIQAMYPGRKGRSKRNYINDCLIKAGRIKKSIPVLESKITKTGKYD